MSTKLEDGLQAVEDALTPARRRKVYRIVQAVLLVLALHQVTTAEQAATYLQALALAAGIVPAQLAARNTPHE